MQRPSTPYFKNRILTPIQYVKGVGPKLARLFEKKGIQTVEDALYFLPRCYEDRRNLRTISELKPGSLATGFGEIMVSGFVFTKIKERRSLKQWWPTRQAPSP